MTAGNAAGGSARNATARPTTLVWIDAREAVIVRREDGQARLERLASDVPAHHRMTGHVRHDPTTRHGGGGRPQTAGEPHRLEHLGRFVELVAGRLDRDDDVMILGPGTVRHRLGRHLREADVHRGRQRVVSCAAAARLTDHQLVARLRHLEGQEPRRRTVGAYRWVEPGPHRPSGQAQPRPRRVVDKPPRPVGEYEP